MADDALPQALLPVAAALGDLPALRADRAAGASACAPARRSGLPPGLILGEADDDATVRAMTAGQMVALARLHGVELSPVRVFNL